MRGSLLGLRRRARRRRRRTSRCRSFGAERCSGGSGSTSSIGGAPSARAARSAAPRSPRRRARTRPRSARRSGSRRARSRCAAACAGLHERDAAALARVGDEHLRPIGSSLEARERLGNRRASRGRRSARTSQPNARNFASRSPRSLTASTDVSDCSLLWSTITVISRRPRFAAGCSDSQNCPSCSSPSPVITNTRPARPAHRSASAMPCAFETPIPSEPVFVTTSGVAATSGWPGRPSSRRSWWISSKSSLPERDQHRVQAGRVVALGREVAVALAASTSRWSHVMMSRQLKRRPDVAGAGLLIM